MKLVQELPYLLIPSPLKPNNYVPEKLNCRLARMDFLRLLNLIFPALGAGTKLLGFPKGVEHPLWSRAGFIPRSQNVPLILTDIQCQGEQLSPFLSPSCASASF